jgi:hypothetical protein
VEEAAAVGDGSKASRSLGDSLGEGADASREGRRGVRGHLSRKKRCSSSSNRSGTDATVEDARKASAARAAAADKNRGVGKGKDMDMAGGQDGASKTLGRSEAHARAEAEAEKAEADEKEEEGGDLEEVEEVGQVGRVGKFGVWQLEQEGA